MSTGTVNVSFAPIGSNLPDFDDYFCRDCRRIIHVRKGSSGSRARDARVRDLRMHAADGVRRVRDDAEAEHQLEALTRLSRCPGSRDAVAEMHPC